MCCEVPLCLCVLFSLADHRQRMWMPSTEKPTKEAVELCCQSLRSKYTYEKLLRLLQKSISLMKCKNKHGKGLNCTISCEES